MDEDLSIIDSKTRNEKIKNFFINNRNKIIIFLIIVLLTIMSFFGFNEYMNAKKKKISDQYNSI